MLADGTQPRKGREVRVEAPRVVHLRHQADVRERDGRTERVQAVGGVALDPCLQRGEALADPVPVPARDRLLVLAERPLQVGEHPQVVERMDVAGDGERHRAHGRAILCTARQQRRLGMSLLEVLADRQRLREHVAVVLERRYESLRIELQVVAVPLLATVAQQVLRHRLVAESLEVQCDPHPVRSRASPVGVQPERHAASLPGPAVRRSWCAASRGGRCRRRGCRPA